MKLLKNSIIVILGTLVIVSFGIFGYGYWFFDGFAGRYVASWNLILINVDNVNLSNLDYVVQHEWGHVIWNNELNETQREQYTEIALKYKNDSDSYCFLGYDDLIKEDFADSYYIYQKGDSFMFWECWDKMQFFEGLG